MLTAKQPETGDNAASLENPPESSETGVKGVLPGNSLKTASGGFLVSKSGDLVAGLPPDVEAFFAGLGQACPICPNCRNLLYRFAVDDLAAAVVCGYCGQLLVIPGASLRLRLMAVLQGIKV